jgi:transcriptional regulator with XRE-family HTH domain
MKNLRKVSMVEFNLTHSKKKSQAKNHLGLVVEYYLYPKNPNGIKRADLARRLGVERSAVTQWIKGKNSFTIEHLLKMLEVFQIDFLDFARTADHLTDWGKFSKNYPPKK